MKKKILKIITLSLIIAIFIAVPCFADNEAFQKAWKKFMDDYHFLVSIVAGVGALTSILVFIIHFIRLGSCPDIPYLRYKIMRDMLTSGVATALLGAITLVMGIFYHVIFGN